MTNYIISSCFKTEQHFYTWKGGWTEDSARARIWKVQPSTRVIEKARKPLLVFDPLAEIQVLEQK